MLLWYQKKEKFVSINLQQKDRWSEIFDNERKIFFGKNLMKNGKKKK